MTYQEKKEEILRNYHCNDSYGESCDCACDDCCEAMDKDLEELHQLAIQDHENERHGTYECFHCGSRYGVVWDSDFDLEDLGYEGTGVVHECHCANCGAEIEYIVRDSNGEK